MRGNGWVRCEESEGQAGNGLFHAFLKKLVGMRLFCNDRWLTASRIHMKNLQGGVKMCPGWLNVWRIRQWKLENISGIVKMRWIVIIENISREHETILYEFFYGRFTGNSNRDEDSCSTYTRSQGVLSLESWQKPGEEVHIHKLQDIQKYYKSHRSSEDKLLC